MKYLTIVLLAVLFMACSEEQPADEQQTMKEPVKKSEKNSQPQVYDDNVTDFLLKLKMKSGDNYILKIGREEKITQSSGSQKQSVKQTEKFDYSFSILEVNDNGDFTAEYLDIAIKSLPEKARAVFVAYAIEGYKHKEIAEMMDISEGTSKSNLARGRAILKEKVSDIINKKEDNNSASSL